MPSEKEFKELIDWVKLKVRRLSFFSEKGTVLDFEKIMGIKSGKQDKISANWKNPEIIFYSLSEFFKKVDRIEGIGINADIVLGDFNYPKQYFYHALKIVENPEIGIPNKEYPPLIIRNSLCTVFIAPKIHVEEIELRNLVDMNNNPDLIEELNLMGKDLRVIPEGIGQLKNLKKLDFAFNQLNRLHYSFEELTSLEELNLEHTALIKLPEWIGELKNLKVLNLSSYKVYHTFLVCQG